MNIADGLFVVGGAHSVGLATTLLIEEFLDGLVAFITVLGQLLDVVVETPFHAAGHHGERSRNIPLTSAKESKNVGVGVVHLDELPEGVSGARRDHRC